MINIEKVAPRIVDGIEMYVSSTGQSGLSQLAIAKLCGISETAVRHVLSDRTKMALIAGEAMPTAGLYLELRSNNQAKIVRSGIASKIIAYYAIKSSNKTIEALYSLEKFAAKGIDGWIKDCVHYVETQGNADSKLFDLLAIMGQDIKEMKADLASTSGYRAARITLPGLKEWMESLDTLYSLASSNTYQSVQFSAQPTKINIGEGFFVRDREQLALAHAEEQLFTLTEWADASGNSMTKSQKHALANIVSSTYKLMALELPPKVTRLNDSGSKKMPVQAYPERHFVLIGMCWAKLITSQI